MPLSASEQQELDDLELEQLEHEEAQSKQNAAPAGPRHASAVEAAGTGSAQAATLGLMPQLVGGITAGINKVKDTFDPVSDLKGGTIPRMGYTQARDLTNKDFDQQKDDHPLAYTGGQLAGSLAPGGLAGKAVSGMGAIKGGMAAGAAMGALSNPGDKEGEISPFQLGDRAVNGVIGGATGAAVGGLSALIGKGAKTAQDFRDLKSGNMADRATAAIDDAASKIGEKQIAPRDQQLRELIQGKQFEVNPDRVKPTFPRLGASMAEGLEADASPQGMSIAGGADSQAPQRAVISGSRALRLKRAADAAANYGASKPFDPVASASGEEAKSLADILRSQINADPKAAQLNEEMGQFHALRDALVKREGTAPIETLQAPLGSSRQAVLSKVDQAAGSNLRGLGKDIGDAKSIELHPDRLVKPLELPSELKAIGLRSAAEVSRLLSKGSPPGTKEALINALSQTKRVK